MGFGGVEGLKIGLRVRGLELDLRAWGSGLGFWCRVLVQDSGLGFRFRILVQGSG